MSQTEFTHLWHEAPILSDALALIPPHVTLLQAAKGNPTANLAAAQAILASSGLTYDGPLMDLAPNLRIIARTGIGVDNVDLAAATERGIVVCNTPDGPTESTAEHTVAMLLALAKMLKQGDANVAAGNFGPRGILLGMEVQGKTLGLVGMGRIGRRVAHICQFGLGMTVLAYDPFITQEQVDDLGVTLTDLDTVISQAHFLSLHAPSTPATVKLMNAARFAQMRDGSYLLNMARGTLVDESALLDALTSGKLAGAGLDVFDPEPPTADSPLRGHPKVIATPHTASVTAEGRARMERMAIQRVIAFFNGEWVESIVNPDVMK